MLVFDGRVICGTRARKTHTKSMNAFSSIDYPDLALLREGRCTVDVLSSPDRWYGVTYREDKPSVTAALRRLTDEGVYPDRPLF